jgi:hypothetical protein
MARLYIVREGFLSLEIVISIPWGVNVNASCCLLGSREEGQLLSLYIFYILHALKCF